MAGGHHLVLKNEAKVYGSPFLDSAWHQLTAAAAEGDGAAGPDPMQAVLASLRGAAVPPRMQGSGGGGGGLGNGGAGAGKGRGGPKR